MDKDEVVQGIVENLARCQKPAMKAVWKDMGLSHAQMSMLYLLHYHKRSNVKQISEYLGITKSAVTQLMEPLADKKLIDRRTDPADRRIVHLSLSVKGKTTLKKMARHKFAGLRARLKTLSDDELRRLSEICRKLSADIEEN